MFPLSADRYNRRQWTRINLKVRFSNDHRTIDCLDTCGGLLHGDVWRDSSWLAGRSLNRSAEKVPLRPPTILANSDAGRAENARAGVMVLMGTPAVVFCNSY